MKKEKVIVKQRKLKSGHGPQRDSLSVKRSSCVSEQYQYSVSSSSLSVNSSSSVSVKSTNILSVAVACQ
jgi:hypothetical protein